MRRRGPGRGDAQGREDAVTVAIVGGTGYLGPRIAERLLARGQDVLVLARGRHPVDLPDAARFAEVDRMDGDRLAEVLWRNQVEAVIDVFSLSLRNTQPVLDAAAAHGARYVLVSSVDVYSNYEGLLKRGSPERRQAPATEDSPLRALRYPYRSNSRRPKGVEDDLFEDYDKIPIEEAARADPRLSAVVVRLPMVFGPRDKQHRFAWAIAAILGDQPIRIDERAAGWLNSYVYVDDAAEGLALAATHPDAPGGIFNVAQMEIRTVRQWVERLAEIMGRKVDIELAPAGSGLQSERAEASDLSYPLTMDGSRIRSALGFAETVPEDEALRMTIDWERSQG